MRARLPAYRINQDGALAEWIPDGGGEYYRHRHLSHLYAAYEANGELTPDGTLNFAAEELRLRADSAGVVVLDVRRGSPASPSSTPTSRGWVPRRASRS